MRKIVVVAGGTGNLGQRIVNALLQEGADVRVIVRSSSDAATVKKLENLGVTVFKADTSNVAEVSNACMGASCVVSALAGLRDVIIDTQKVLLDAAIIAGVPRFIPSDFSLDFTNLEVGGNRNLDLRREFHHYLDKTTIAATTIFVGPFMDLLTDQMPMILFKPKRILYWGNADQRIDFTTMDDTAAFTANVALDDGAPRFLRVAGAQISPRQLATVVSEVTGNKFRLLRAGGLGLLNLLIRVARTVAPGKNELYPAWQGMQYMRDMMEGRAKIDSYDNNRYQGMRWTTVKAILSLHQHENPRNPKKQV
ncbi:SDR family NAD(P)-dependent oxidoreductase [Spirosoma arcticum]